ncbi:MAG TPA: MFS transporter, partial [Vicinamibacterales bacterium]|nr:MFS transporter [Vicinamibacterales bacterium]
SRDTRLAPRQLYVAITSFVVLFSIVGLSLYGLPFYYDFMVKEFGWSRAQVTSGNALSKLLIGPLFGFMAGWIVDRFGPGRLMMAGILMAGIALIGLAHMTSLWMFYAFYVLNALGYVCGGPLPNQVLLSRWFDASRGKAMGFAYLGIGLGGYLVLRLSPRLVEAFGWRGALQVLGILIVALALPLAFFVRDEPETAVAATGGAPARADATQVAPMGGIFRNPAFYLLAIGSMCSIGAVGGTNQHLKLFLSLDLKFSQTAAASIASTVLACSIAGRLLMGWLADRIARKHVMLLIYGLIAGSIPLLFFAQSQAALYAFAIIFGLGLGGEYMIIPLMAAELFGVKVLGRLLGVILTADGVAEATFPMLVGYLRDKTGTYRSGFLVLIAVALAGTIAITFLPRRGVPATEASHV